MVASIRWQAVASALCLGLAAASADCTVTNLDIPPLPDVGPGYYKGVPGGIHPRGAGFRPFHHEAAGIAIARNQVVPRSASGAVNTNDGRIGLLSIGMSNTTQEWASKGRENFKVLADRDPAKHPRLVIVDGAQGGQDADNWTNFFAATWTNALVRVANAGLTTNQVQVIWLKQARAGPNGLGAFPAHARVLEDNLVQILRTARQRFPNLALAYLSGRTRAYTTNPPALNPEPFAFETGFSVRWVVEEQLAGGLNYDVARGAVVAPWISWGPYLWGDGISPRSDGFLWNCADLENDFTHPSTNGVAKVGHHLLAFFKTDPTTTPWFLRTPTQALSGFVVADATNGPAPLTVNLSATVIAPPFPVVDYRWTFSDGTFALGTNATKAFHAPGPAFARVTVSDTNGNSGTFTLPFFATITLDAWKAAKFTPAELANPTVSGDEADADSDGIPNRMEFLLGTDPRISDPITARPRAAIVDGHLEYTYSLYKPARGVTFEPHLSTDLETWQPVAGLTTAGGEFRFTTTPLSDDGLVQTLTLRETQPVTSTGQAFLRLVVASVP